MGQVLITEQYLSDIGSAIRAKTGTSEAFKPAQMASAIEAIPSGGSTEREDGLVARTLSSYENSTATKIGSSAFYDYRSLKTVSFLNVTNIGGSAFGYCYSLTTVNFPNVTTIGNYAFTYCSRLTTTSFPNTTSVGSYAFSCCSSLATVSFPSATYIGNGAFKSCYRLLSLYLLGSSITTLASTAAFTSTPISNYTMSTGAYGSIYVPASLYSSYITATNWAVYSSRFVSA